VAHLFEVGWLGSVSEPRELTWLFRRTGDHPRGVGKVALKQLKLTDAAEMQGYDQRAADSFCFYTRTVNERTLMRLVAGFN